VHIFVKKKGPADRRQRICDRLFLRKDQVLLLAGHECSSSAAVGKKHVSSSFTILPVSFCNCEQYCTAIPPSMCYLVKVSLSSDRSTTGH
jgi:hypothetical protein